MFGICPTCKTEIDGLTRELNRDGVCSECEAATIRTRPADVPHLDRQIAEEFPGQPITPELRALYVGRLLMYRDMLLRLRTNLSKSGIFDSGPEDNDIRKRATWQTWQTVRRAS